MPVFTDHVDLAGASGSDLPTDATGTVLDGAFQVPLDRTRPPRYDKAYALVSTSLSTVGSTDYDVELYNYTSDTSLTSLSGATSEVAGKYLPVNLSEVSDGDALGVKVTVNTASGTADSTADVGVTLVLAGTK